jgi:hypothetical protein
MAANQSPFFSSYERPLIQRLNRVDSGSLHFFIQKSQFESIDRVKSSRHTFYKTIPRILAFLIGF